VHLKIKGILDKIEKNLSWSRILDSDFILGTKDKILFWELSTNK
jgi:hypothetical protein